MARVNAFMYGPDFDERMAASRGPLTETARIECSPLSVPSPARPSCGWAGRRVTPCGLASRNRSRATTAARTLA